MVAGWAPGALRAAEPVTLKVIAYNVQFLPGLAAVANKRKQPAYRATRLGEVLAAFDVVGLNEVFEERPREMILAGLRQAWGERYAAVVIAPPDDGRFNGGLAIASRYPIVASHQIIYSVSSSPKDYGLGADGFAGKGALHARIALGSEPGAPTVDVFCTHLEARADELRPTQYRELGEFIRQHTAPERPLLVLGDMNTRGNEADVARADSAYHQMLASYQAGRGDAPLRDAWLVAGQGPPGTGDQEDSPDGGNRIDYIFYSAPVGNEAAFRPRVVTVNRYLDPRTGALSDHNAVEGVFEWLAR